MSFRRVENPTLVILRLLEANFFKKTKENLVKFDSKYDVRIFLGYSTTSKAYRVFNQKTLVVEKSMHVVFDESNAFKKREKHRI